MPLPVLERVQEELLALPGVGASVLEISHREKPFLGILASAKANLTRLLNIPSNYRILFLQGGSRLQFSMVPMNLLRGQSQPAQYILTGAWGKKAREEAVKEGQVEVLWDGKPHKYDRLPQASELKVNPQAAYVHITSNETIEGVQFLSEPDTAGAPLVCDASSDFLCRPLPIEQYGLIYACAQKNAGPAGVTIVIVREDLLERSRDDLPGYCNYKSHALEDSLYNTPPTFAIYVVNLITEWLLNDVGGLDKMLQRNRDKAKLLYDVLDQSQGFYRGHAQPQDRSLMNVTFRLPSEEVEKKFLAGAAERGLNSIKGHRSVGGIRASIYNAMPVEGVELLRDYMLEFQEANRQ